MNSRSTLTRTLAIAGTILVWLPIAFMLLTSVIGSLREETFLLDYFIPAELLPIVLAGSVLLLWAAFRARSRKRVIGGAIAVALGALPLGLLLAQVTGLASGATEPTGWQFVLVMALIALYVVAVIAIGVGGVLLVRDLFTPDRLIK